MRLPYLPTNDVYCSSKLPFLYSSASTKKGEKFAKNSTKNGIKWVSDAKKYSRSAFPKIFYVL